MGPQITFPPGPSNYRYGTGLVSDTDLSTKLCIEEIILVLTLDIE